MTEDLKHETGEVEISTGLVATEPEAGHFEGAAGTETLQGQATATITPPPAGQTVVLRPQPGERLELIANPADVRIAIEGNNVILAFDLDGDGKPDSQVVLEELVILAESANPPAIVVGGQAIAADALIGGARALTSADSGAPTIETAADAGAEGTGATKYDDSLGEVIDLLVAQGVIPPVFLQFGLIEREEIVLFDEENNPPEADPVLTPAERGELPPDLVTALDNIVIHSETITIAGPNLPGSVQYIYFTLTEASAVTITTDGPTIDPQIYLFVDDGSLDAADFLATDDDDGTPAGSFFNSVINTGDEIGILPPGNYVIAVSDFSLNLSEAVSGLNDSTDLTGDVTVTVALQAPSPDSIVFFKQLNVDGSIGDDDSGVIADFGGADAETSLENLVFTLQSNPTFGQLILVTSGGNTSLLTPGDTYTSEDTVWWIATEDQIAAFLAQEGAPEFLPDVNFLYSVTDEAGASATAPVTITLPPPQPPRTAIGVEQEGCLNEDTEGTLAFNASPTDGASKISQIIISGFPTGGVDDAWVVDETSVSLDGLTFGVDFFVDYDDTTGVLTIDIVTASLSLGEPVNGTVDVTPNPDSDVDRTLTIEATAINGAGDATGDSSSVIPVDADADSGPSAVGGNNDDDGVHLSVSASVWDSNDDGGTFQPDEIGTLTIEATFDDFTDGSEIHTIVIKAPAGFTILGVIGDLPDGVSLTDGVGDIWTFDVDTLNGVGSAVLELEIQNTGVEKGTADFEILAVAEETNTGDIECVGGGEGGINPVPGDNVAVADDTATATVADVAPPTVTLSLPDEVDCIEEDSTTSDASNEIVVTVTPDGDDKITEIEISGLQSDWTYDLGGLEVDGATLTDGDPSDGSITLSVPNLTSYSGSFAVQPPADSDIDHPTITVTATVVDPVDSNLTTTGDGTIDIHVDAVVDGGALVSGTPDTSDSGAVVDLNLTLAPQGGNAGNPTGDAFNGGGFDTDGSESVTKVVVTLSGDADAILTSSNGALFASLLTGSGGLVWTFEGSQSDLQTLTTSLQVDPSDDFEGDIDVQVDVTTTELATEAGSPVPDGDGSNGVHGYECDDENNSLTETFNFTVPVDNSAAPEAVIGVDGDDCLLEDTKGTLAFSADPQSAGDTITEIVISGFPTGSDAWDVDVASLSLAGLTLGVDYTVSFVAGILTISITGAAADATVTGTIDVTPNADSDIDGSLTIDATAVDGVASSTSNNDPTPIDVDAVADGEEGSGGDDGDSSHLSVEINVTDNGGDGSFQTGETGVLEVSATFDDYKDGSEEHLVTVTAPTGYFIGDAISLPAGVTVDSNDGTTLVLRVDSQDGDGQDGVGSFTATFDLTNLSALEGTADFTAVASAEELNTNTDPQQGDVECDLQNNLATAEDSEEVDAADPDVEVLNIGIITNTNSTGQKGVITFYDQANILTNAYAAYIVFSFEGQALAQNGDTGFAIDPNAEYTYGLEADAGNGSRIGLDELVLEGLAITEPAQITGLAPDSVGGNNDFAISGRFTPNTGEGQVATLSTDGDDDPNALSDPTAPPTVNFLWGDLDSDTLTGGSGSDILNGGPGADTILGSGGNDIIVYDPLDTIDGGAGDDLLRIDAIGQSITSFNSGGTTFVHMTGALTEVDFVSTNITNVEGLLITDQPLFKGGDVIGGTVSIDGGGYTVGGGGVLLLDPNDDGVATVDENPVLATVGVKLYLDPEDVIDVSNADTLTIQGNEGDILALVDSDGAGAGTWAAGVISGDYQTFTYAAGGPVLATVHVEIGTFDDQSIQVLLNQAAFA